MEMIRNQRPAVAGCGGLLQNRTESFQKPVSIGIVFKNVSSLDTPAYDARYPAHLFWLDVACDFITTNKLKKKRLNSTPSPFTSPTLRHMTSGGTILGLSLNLEIWIRDD